MSTSRFISFMLLFSGFAFSTSFGQIQYTYHWSEDDHQFIIGIIKDLTLDEKLILLAGVALPDSDTMDGNMDNFGITGIPGKGIPDFIMGHGITGVRAGRDLGVRSTYFGTPMAYASSWDLDLYRRVGVAIAKEMRGLGLDLNFGPTINIIRHPLGGRNWECLSEDPYLTSRFIVPYVRAMQSEGIICGPKHYVANNQDHNRFDINNVIDDRTLREIYLPAFRASVVEGGALNIMGAYNRLNGVFMCHHRYMLTDILREEWGFSGFVISDANSALRSTLAGVYSGTDVDLNVDNPGPRVYGKPLKQEIMDGAVSTSMIDSMVYRVLKTMHLIDIFNRPRSENESLVHCTEHQAIASEVAVKSPVLLKNGKNILPLDNRHYRSIAVIGPQAKRYPDLPPDNRNYAYYLQGGGSGRTYYFPEAVIDPFTGISKEFSGKLEFRYAQGCQSPVQYRQNGPAIENSEDERLIREAVSVARKADLSILCVGLSGFNESEGWDRTSAAVPGFQEKLIEEVAGVCKNTIVVLISGSYVDVSPWVEKVDALLFVPYSGEKIGEGIAAILTGKVSPSGKLPISWPRSVDDYPEGSILTGPGYSESGVSNVYSEGIYVGYRWFDREGIEPMFPFGHGLSYSSFDYSNLEVKATGDFTAEVRFTLENTGDMTASEICQLYVHDIVSSLDRPEQELKGFLRVELEPGQQKDCVMKLDRTAFAFYHPDKKEWVSERGTYVIRVGSSSRNIQLAGRISY